MSQIKKQANAFVKPHAMNIDTNRPLQLIVIIKDSVWFHQKIDGDSYQI